MSKTDATDLAVILARGYDDEFNPRENEFSFSELNVKMEDSSARKRLHDAGFVKRRTPNRRVYYSYPGMTRQEAIEYALSILPKPLNPETETCVSLVAARAGISRFAAGVYLDRVVAVGKARRVGERILPGVGLVEAYEIIE